MAKKSVSWQDYLIEIDEKGAVKVSKNGVISPSALGALREIARAVDFKIEDKWNTQQTGAKLAKFIEGLPQEHLEKQSTIPSKQGDNETGVNERRAVSAATTAATRQLTRSILSGLFGGSVSSGSSESSKSTDSKTHNNADSKNDKTDKRASSSNTTLDKFHSGDSLHNVANPEQSIKKLNENTHKLPAEIQLFATNVHGEPLVGLVTDFVGTFISGITKHSESSGLKYKYDPRGASGFRNYRFWSNGSSSDVVLPATVETFNCEKTETCQDCGGKGKCSACRGKGEEECVACSGTGRCRECSGRGKIECPECNGSGRCVHCNGNGYSYVCPDCGGTGKAAGGATLSNLKGKCKRCGGSGRSYHTCQYCLGSGKCTPCNARGRIICPSCGGDKICPKCNGAKKIVCEQCKGRKYCTSCDGKGIIPCQRCNGTGNFQTYELMRLTLDKVSKHYVDYSNSLDIKLNDDKIPYKEQDLICSWSHKNEDYNEAKAIHSSDYADVICKAKYELDCYSIIADYLGTISKIRLLETNQSIRDRYAKELSIKTYGFPISIYSFKFENKDYRIVLAGRGNAEIYGTYPQQHFFEGVSFESKGLFSSLKRSVTGLLKSDQSQRFDICKSLVVLSVWIAKQRGLSQEKILEDFELNSFFDSQKEVQRITDAIEKIKTEKDLYKEISCLSGSSSAAVWAYIFADGEPIYKDISSHLGISDEDFFNKIELFYSSNQWKKLGQAKLLSLFGKQFIKPV